LVGVLAVIGALTLLVGVVAGAVLAVALVRDRDASEQTAAALAPFYTSPTELPAQPGEVIRSAPLGFDVNGGTGYRVIYTSENSDGDIVPVSGMVFVPDAPAPDGGRKVLAYAHGTVGTDPDCAPSRATSAAELASSDWLDPALQQGWVVTATDYLGLGLPGPSSYLISDQEARDVVNSVRAAGSFDGADAGSEWVVLGSSQGGNSALWTAYLAAELAPELDLRAVMASVPAAELGATVQAQWSTAAAWALVPAILSSWPEQYPDADFEAILTDQARSALGELSKKCIVDQALDGLIRDKVGEQFFTSDPTEDPAWARAIRDQTPPIPDPDLPMLLLQGTADVVVLAGSNATLQEQWCRVRPMTSLWLGGVSHQDTVNAGGPAAINWARERFAGTEPMNTCSFGVPAPVEPLRNPLPRQ
jgi:alpha-beta hydrolase superfamily lysophospholipase